MSYIQKQLLKDEKIIYQTTLNKTVYLLGGILTFLGLIIWLIDGTLGSIFTISGTIILILTYLNVKMSEFAVTDKRIIIRVGILKTTSLETMLNKIEGIHVEQGLIGKMTNSGTLIIKGTGGTNNPFPNINNPFEFRMAVNQEIEKLKTTI
jgi:uncharacterized membrane protein YdbT with pleckstrin-like domain